MTLDEIERRFHRAMISIWERGRLDLTVEAYVLRDEFASLFADQDREQACLRLEQYGWRPNAGPS